MIVTETKVEIESSGILKELDFGIKAENMGFILNILRNSLYSNKILAVVREYSCNARDAHVAAGKPNLPIQISVPYQLDPFFRVRDFGLGMSEEEIQEIFINYGCSSKRGDNQAVGAFGLGAKCGFALNDSFLVTSFRDGVRYDYSLYIDSSKRGKMSLMSKTETTESNGVEVSIPFPSHSVPSLINEIKRFFLFWDVKPNFVNLSDADKPKDITFSISGEGWGLFDAEGRNSISAAGIHGPILVMGGVPYPISGDLCQIDPWRYIDRYVLFADIGDVDIVPSREGLEITPKTKKFLENLFQKALVEVRAEINKMIQNTSSLYEAQMLYNEVRGHNGGCYYHFVHVWQYKGYKLTGHFTNPHGFRVFCKKRARNSNGLIRVRDSRGFMNHFIPNKKDILVHNDLAPNDGSLLKRVTPLIETKGYNQVYLVSNTSGQTVDQWIAKSGYDGPLLKLSDCPPIPLSTFYPSLKKSGTYVPKPKDGKAKCSVFVLTDDPLSKVNPREHWEISKETDISKLRGYFVPIDNRSYRPSLRSMDTLHSYRQVAESLGISIPCIYGIKESDIDEANKNKNLVRVHDFIREFVQKEVDKYRKEIGMLSDNGIYISLIDTLNAKKFTAFDCDALNEVLKRRAELKELEVKVIRNLKAAMNIVGVPYPPMIELVSSQVIGEIVKCYPMVSVYGAYGVSAILMYGYMESMNELYKLKKSLA
jgi:hypothetical protein